MSSPKTKRKRLNPQKTSSSSKLTNNHSTTTTNLIKYSSPSPSPSLLLSQKTNLPSITDSSEPIQILRGSWRFLNFFEFCRIYRPLFSLPRFSLADLENDLLPENHETGSVPPEKTKTVSELMIRLLSNLKVKGVSSITSENWQSVLRGISSVYYGPPFFPDDSSFDALPLASRIHLMHLVSELVFEGNLERISNLEMEADQQRVFPIGEDSNGRTYWLFGDNRLYVELPVKKKSTPSLAEYTFSLVASTSESWETCLDPLSRSRSRIDKQLQETLKPIAEASRAKLLAKEREAARQAYLDSLPKKRSERIVAKQAQEEEKARLEQLMKEQAIAEAARKAEERRLKDEERKRKLEEEAEEERRRAAEQKAFQIEQAHIREEQRKRMKTLMQVSEKALLADLAEVLRNRGLPPESAKSPQPVDAMANLLTQDEDKPKLVRFSKDLAAYNSTSLTGRPGRSAVPTLAEFWLGGEENGKAMTTVLKLWCRDLLDGLIAKEDSWPFVEPVDPIALDIPHYVDVIANPMDFGTMRQKTVCSEYGNFREFWGDLGLVLNNCIKFNGVKSPYSVLARKMEEVIVGTVTSCGIVVEDEGFVPEGFIVPPTPAMPSPSPVGTSEPPEGGAPLQRPRRAAALRKSLKEESDNEDEDDDDNLTAVESGRTPTRKGSASESVSHRPGPYGAVRLHAERPILPKNGTEMPRIRTDLATPGHPRPRPNQLPPPMQSPSHLASGTYRFTTPDHHHHHHNGAPYPAPCAHGHPYPFSPSTSSAPPLPPYQTWHPSTPPVHGPCSHDNGIFASSESQRHLPSPHHHPHHNVIQPRIAPAPSTSIHGSVVSPFALPSPSILARSTVPWPGPPPPPTPTPQSSRNVLEFPHQYHPNQLPAYHYFPPIALFPTTTMNANANPANATNATVNASTNSNANTATNTNRNANPDP